jgi:hypothetical protein
MSLLHGRQNLGNAEWIVRRTEHHVRTVAIVDRKLSVLGYFFLDSERLTRSGDAEAAGMDG